MLDQQVARERVWSQVLTCSRLEVLSTVGVAEALATRWSCVPQEAILSIWVVLRCSALIIVHTKLAASTGIASRCNTPRVPRVASSLANSLSVDRGNQIRWSALQMLRGRAGGFSDSANSTGGGSVCHTWCERGACDGYWGGRSSHNHVRLRDENRRSVGGDCLGRRLFCNDSGRQ